MTWKTIFISIISLFLFLMISGCGSNVKNENIPAEEEWGEGLGELPNKIGEEQDLYGTNFLSPGKSTNAHKLSEYTEYQTPTGNWFLHDGQGHLGYGITSGTQKTGSPIFIDLISHEGNGTTINKEIHIQLTQRNSELEKMELIIEETKSLGAIKGEERIYSAKLPEQENVFYILSAEIIDEHGEVEDTLISLIYVPSEEMNVEINTNKETYQSTDSEATLKIKNDGPTILQLGKHYSLEKK
ncbi:hypothetical protein D8M06_19350 [Oceanobacillus halophilus]|uniref:Bacterial Ig-like domain-containing protein n=1 Tax=Oceanobacillus halophilus TaxID=930130 RepID=A0A494ZRH5_9BACI|nr:immunoglobulin-like domain-containing protein [Oceanobacillus halophilus]RKQ28124.1 hypothetical protein D8M06_19350 [Oceanobacillus halophilus]